MNERRSIFEIDQDLKEVYLKMGYAQGFFAAMAIAEKCFTVRGTINAMRNHIMERAKVDGVVFKAKSDEQSELTIKE